MQLEGKLTYRPEIDGLRAIAVIAVVLFHAELVLGDQVLFKGGFIGVDVFFVISGYLITSIILKDLQQQSFSFVAFYERRARRILPALLFIILVCISFAWVYLLPREMIQYSNSILYSLGFLSNLWFWQEVGYFAEPAFLQPFLHTWSLSIEEQFYLLFPFFLCLTWKYARKYLLHLGATGFVLSLLLAQYSSDQFPVATFYFLPTRGWELLAGGILAKIEMSKGRNSRPLFNAILPALGMCLIVGSFVLFDSQVRHPSLVTVVPVLGAVLLIWFSRPGEIVTELLSSKPFVSIGITSYSIYLWHFPIFAFSRIDESVKSNLDKIGLIALALALSGLTYFLIEQPARNRQLLSRKKFVSSILFLVLCLGSIHFLFIRFEGLPSRLGPVASLFQELESRDRSPFSSANPRLKIINLGDSHAGALHHALFDLAKRQEFSLTTIELLACYPIRGAYFEIGQRPGNKCESKAIERTLNGISQQPPSLIILSGRLPWYLTGTEVIEEGSNWKRPRSIDHRLKFADGRPAGVTNIAEALQETINEWAEKGHKIVLMYPIPEMTTNIPYSVKKQLDGVPAYKQLAVFNTLDLSISREMHMKRTAGVRKVFDRIATSKQVVKVDPSEILCGFKDGKCLAIINSKLMYRDDHHLSTYGARLVVQHIAQKVKELRR